MVLSWESLAVGGQDRPGRPGHRTGRPPSLPAGQRARWQLGRRAGTPGFASPQATRREAPAAAAPARAGGPAGFAFGRYRRTLMMWMFPHCAGWARPPGPAIALLDQTRLPADEAIVTCTDVPELVTAIRRLVVRGAPLLGVAGAYGVALAACRGDDVAGAAAAIEAARPTAVNLGWGARRALAAHQRALEGQGPGCETGGRSGCRRRGGSDRGGGRPGERGHGGAGPGPGPRAGPDPDALQHRGAGLGREGTAFAVILAAHRAGRLAQLWIDETRPLLQGGRLTAYEAGRAGIPHTVLADGAAGSLFAAGLVDMVLIGADRIAADGSVANKVGSYGLAVLAGHHHVPFVVVAPTSTVDPATPDGGAIEVEMRPRGGGHQDRRSAGGAGRDGRLQPGVRRHAPRADHGHRHRTRESRSPSQRVTCVCWAGALVRRTVPLPPFTWNDGAYERSRAGRR